MKKNLFAMMTASVALCIGFQSANANLLGMPLNLRIATQFSVVDAPAAACQFYSDAVLTGGLSVKGCLRT
jgi:hypothetical protein